MTLEDRGVMGSSRLWVFKVTTISVTLWQPLQKQSLLSVICVSVDFIYRNSKKPFRAWVGAECKQMLYISVESGVDI